MVKNICIYRRDSVFRSIYALDHGVMDHIKHYRMVFTTSWKSAKAGWGGEQDSAPGRKVKSACKSRTKATLILS